MSEDTIEKSHAALRLQALQLTEFHPDEPHACPLAINKPPLALTPSVVYRPIVQFCNDASDVWPRLFTEHASSPSALAIAQYALMDSFCMKDATRHTALYQDYARRAVSTSTRGLLMVRT
jgi:hypothetical protein